MTFQSISLKIPLSKSVQAVHPSLKQPRVAPSNITNIVGIRIQERIKNGCWRYQPRLALQLVTPIWSLRYEHRYVALPSLFQNAFCHNWSTELCIRCLFNVDFGDLACNSLLCNSGVTGRQEDCCTNCGVYRNTCSWLPCQFSILVVICPDSRVIICMMYHSVFSLSWYEFHALQGMILPSIPNRKFRLYYFNPDGWIKMNESDSFKKDLLDFK